MKNLFSWDLTLDKNDYTEVESEGLLANITAENNLKEFNKKKESLKKW